MSIEEKYPLLIGHSDQGSQELRSIQEVADFICSQGLESDLLITQEDGSYFLNTFGIYIDRIADMEYREALLKVLIPMQMELDGTNAIDEEPSPEDEREEIEALIRQEEAQAQREAEAARRFAVIHFHEDGDDFHFTSDLRNTFYSAAYRYRNFLQEDVGKLTLDSLAVAFGEHQPIDDLTFSVLCDAMEHDERITALLEFDFDSGIISVKEQADPEWRSYWLKDVSTAIYRAERKNGLSLQTREQIFEDALHGQEIQQKEAEEITPQIQGM